MLGLRSSVGLLKNHRMADKLTYTEAGVDTVKAAALVGDIRTHVQRTQRQRQLMGGYGLFAAALELEDYRNPVIVTGCDGVGTKLEVQLEYDRIEDAGKDLVAMSVNDILVQGAKRRRGSFYQGASNGCFQDGAGWDPRDLRRIRGSLDRQEHRRADPRVPRRCPRR